jgi:hypothetical protein
MKIRLVIVVQYLGCQHIQINTIFFLFLWGLMKEMTYRTKVHMREELVHQTMDAATYI